MTFTRARRHILVLPIALLLLLGIAQGASAAPAQIPCSAAGGGHYNCSFWPEGDGTSGGSPVVDLHGTLRGYLNQGTNWIACQQVGEKYTSHGYYNTTWAMTEANDGNWGWVSAVYANGGDNEGTFAGVPDCAGKYGQAPGGTPAGATTTSTTPPPPSIPPSSEVPPKPKTPPPTPPSSSAPSAGETLPEPVNMGSYGTYSFIYELKRGPDNLAHVPNFMDWNTEDLMNQLNMNFSHYFTYTGCGDFLVVGEQCTLNAKGPDAPVEVIAISPTGVALKSLGGHPEGAGRTIEFQFEHEIEKNGHEAMVLSVQAWGPLSKMSLLGFWNSSSVAWTSWKIFAHNISTRYPNEPPPTYEGPEEH